MSKWDGEKYGEERFPEYTLEFDMTGHILNMTEEWAEHKYFNDCSISVWLAFYGQDGKEIGRKQMAVNAPDSTEQGQDARRAFTIFVPEDAVTFAVEMTPTQTGIGTAN